MQTTWLNNLVIGYTWTWPILEIIHFLGMCLLIGSIIVIDLRVMGFERIIPAVSIHRLLPLTFIGFGVNFLTGIMFLFGDPYRYAVNISFQLKMILVLLAGLNALLYKFKVEPLLEGPAAVANGGDFPFIAKAVGAASLLFWLGVMSFGRLIPYLGTG